MQLRSDLLAQRYQRVDWTVLACSGAAAQAINPEPRHRWFGFQVEDALARIDNLPSNHPVLVSITIGANDFEWSDGWNFVEHLYLENDDVYRTWVDDVVAKVKESVTPWVEFLLARPNVAVIVTEVYNPFNKKSVFFKLPNSECRPFASCYERTRYAVTQLNGVFLDMYVGLGRPERLQITALQGIFDGHESPKSNQESKKCGDAKPGIARTWIQYSGDPNSYSYPSIPAWVPGEWRGDCFHPNETGAQEIAKAINEDALRIGR